MLKAKKREQRFVLFVTMFWKICFSGREDQVDQAPAYQVHLVAVVVHIGCSTSQ